jgi:DNA-binding GntR family transcriptional regulator
MIPDLMVDEIVDNLPVAVARHSTASRLISTLKFQLVRFQYRTILVPGRSERSFAEHTAIVDAIAAGDPDAAEAAMRTHLSHVAEAAVVNTHRRAGVRTP